MRDAVGYAIDVLAPGGGFILSSSNSIHSSVNPANYLAMVNTVRAYGKYPLRFDFDASGAGEAFSPKEVAQQYGQHALSVATGSA